MTDPERALSGRFAAGTSGNPKGRPRKDASVSGAILEAASAKITATENGRRRKISKVAAAAAQIANKGASGDFRSSKLLLEMTAKAQAEVQGSPAGNRLTPSDQEIVDTFLADYRAYLAEGGA